MITSYNEGLMFFLANILFCPFFDKELDLLTKEYNKSIST